MLLSFFSLIALSGSAKQFHNALKNVLDAANQEYSQVRQFECECDAAKWARNRGKKGRVFKKLKSASDAFLRSPESFDHDALVEAANEVRRV